MRAFPFLMLCIVLILPSPASAQGECDLGCQIERFFRVIFEGILQGSEPEGPESDPPADPVPRARECVSEADVCFQREGVFHHAVPGNPEEKILLPVPPGTYHRIRVSFDAMNGGPLEERGTRYIEQLIFWLAVRGDRQRYGFVRLRRTGPNYQLNVSHGVGTPFEKKIVHKTRLYFPFGTVYHWDYLYDAANRTLLLTVTDPSGKRVARVKGVPNVSRIVRPRGHDFHLNFGYGARPNENEYRSFGWKFSDLVVEVFQ
ncbi:MAG: hypothetical protein R3234_07550 [Thermoanaerobaculia bacterium]|nr:hypothetical protein [Thermoanaerobaculia bacterium]